MGRGAPLCLGRSTSTLTQRRRRRPRCLRTARGAPTDGRLGSLNCAQWQGCVRVRSLNVPGQIRAACARRAGAVGRCLPRCTPGGAGRSFECSQAICTVVRATCNNHVLLHRQRLIVEVVHGVAAETVSRRRGYRTWQGAVNVERVYRCRCAPMR
jgi:hypothetical protein